jgi:hypothetical protein
VRDRDEVDLEHRVDLVEVLVLEQPAGHAAGVVDEDVDVLGVERVVGGVDRVAAAEVHPHRAHVRDRLERVGVADAREHLLHVLPRERLGDRPSDAAVGTRHESCPAVEVHVPAYG